MSRMRRSLRFLSSCSSSSLIFIGISFLPFIEQEVIAGDAAQDHTFEPVQIVETVTGGFLDSQEHRLARILAKNPQQLAQSKGEKTVSTDRKSTRLNSS